MHAGEKLFRSVLWLCHLQAGDFKEILKSLGFIFFTCKGGITIRPNHSIIMVTYRLNI